MDPEPEVIQKQIVDTRQSLTEKLETLENQVRGTVESAKTTVEETIAGVKRTFDVNYQVRQHPFGCLAGTFVGGLALGYLMGNRPALARVPATANVASSGDLRDMLARRQGSLEYLRPQGVAPMLQSSPTVAEGTLSRQVGKFDEELGKIKGLVIGAVLGLVRDFAKQALPPALAPHVEEVMDSATAKLGGQPLDSPLVRLSEPNGRH
jgi:hypothetical protein